MRSFLGLWFALLVAQVLPAQQFDPAEVRQRAERVLRAADCQTALPGESPSWSSSTGEEERRRRRENDFDGGFVAAPVALSEFVLWAIVLGAIALLGFAIARSFGVGDRPVRQQAVVGKAVAVVAPTADLSLPDHAALAGRGEFTAAIRAVLTHAVGTWARQRGPVPVEVTAREFLGRVRAAGVASAALSGLVTSVERSWFGGQPTDRERYAQSLAQLQEWVAQCQTSNPR